MARLGLAIPVHVLRGGQIDNDYADALAAEAVIVGTLDQVVSRQLMRGYCCSRWSWAARRRGSWCSAPLPSMLRSCRPTPPAMA
jgi:hypothetical protein